jgi:hypothetical protein
MVGVRDGSFFREAAGHAGAQILDHHDLAQAGVRSAAGELMATHLDGEQSSARHRRSGGDGRS